MFRKFCEENIPENSYEIYTLFLSYEKIFRQLRLCDGLVDNMGDRRADWNILRIAGL